MGYICEGQIEWAMFHDAMGEMGQDGTLSHDVIGGELGAGLYSMV